MSNVTYEKEITALLMQVLDAARKTRAHSTHLRTQPFVIPLGQATRSVVKDATAGYSDVEMHAALDVYSKLRQRHRYHGGNGRCDLTSLIRFTRDQKVALPAVEVPWLFTSCTDIDPIELALPLVTVKGSVSTNWLPY